MFGKQYVIEHVIAEYNNRMEQLAYRSYTSDVLKAIAEMMGANIPKRFAELINNETVEETKTGDEIALDVINRAGLRAKDGRS